MHQAFLRNAGCIDQSLVTHELLLRSNYLFLKILSRKRIYIFNQHYSLTMTITALLFLFMGPVIFLIIRNNWKPTEGKRPVRKIVFAVYIVLIVLYFAALYAGKYNYYIKGYRSTSILFLLMTLSGIIYWIADRNKVITGFLRVILFCFTVITIFFSTFLSFELVSDYKRQLVYNDKKYRLEETGRSIMNPCGLPALFVKNSFFEQEYMLADKERDYCLVKEEILHISLQPINKEQVMVTFVHKKDTSWQIANPLKVIYQKQ